MASSAPSGPMTSKPMSVAQIVSKAQDYDFNQNIPLRYWLRTADTLLREADIYESEGNNQQTYLLLMRYANLVAEQLLKHPDAHTREGKKELKGASRKVSVVLDRLESLKPAIQERYELWTARVKSLESYGQEEKENYIKRISALSASDNDPAVAGQYTVAAADHGELAVRMGNSEIKRRDTLKRATSQAGVPDDVQLQRRTAGGLWDHWESDLSGDRASREDADLRRRLQETRRRLDYRSTVSSESSLERSAQEEARRSAKPQSSVPRQTSEQILDYKYPTVRQSQPVYYEDRLVPHRDSDYELPPQRPTKESLYAPQIPAKSPIKPSYDSTYSSLAPPRPPPYDAETSLTSSPSPSLKAQPSYTFRPSAYLENGQPLRTLFLPSLLRKSFLRVAFPNTQANLETCGMLCGTLISNALFVQKLVIPAQISTSDTCETVDESALFDFCDKEDLMVLGWIHTHPSQTCFMSSRDLHTHCGYQVMMPEAVAIVCAPSKEPSWGVFRLTDPPGMPEIKACTKPGIFHPHSSDNIYTDALRPGHVYEAPNMDFEVVDLRP